MARIPTSLLVVLAACAAPPRTASTDSARRTRSNAPAPATAATLAPAMASGRGAGAPGRSAAVPGRGSGPPVAAPTIGATKGMQRFYARPSHHSELVGLFRAGQSVSLRAAEPLKGEQPGACPGGWYAVAPRGYVCHGQGTTLDPASALLVARRLVLPGDDAYPFSYGTAQGSPRYLRLPTPGEQRRHEPGLDTHFASLAATERTGPEPPQALLAALRDRARLQHKTPAFAGTKLAWATEMFANGRRWAVTPELYLVPRDKIDAAPRIADRHAALSDIALPFARVLSRSVRLALRDGRVEREGEWQADALVALGPRTRWLGKARWLESTAGLLLAKRDAAVFRKRPRPRGVGPHDKWVHVSVLGGALVAYEGDDPVFAAPVSPGIDGVNPDGPHRTPPGRYRVSSKSLAVAMGGDLAGGGSWRTREVPWVAYYDQGYALHGAWWHQGFGRPKSHGCVNLTPGDARVLFRWLDPPLPRGWHTVVADVRKKTGTLIVIQP